MSIFLDIEPVPFRLLDDLANQMDANNEALKARQGEKGSTDRPSAQRAAHNADQSTYRRPEPAASPRGGDLSVCWAYYGGDGELWLRDAIGRGPWRNIGRHVAPYKLYEVESVQPENAGQFSSLFLENRYTFDVAEWVNDGRRLSKAWSPTYGGKGVYDDWYQMLPARSLHPLPTAAAIRSDFGIPGGDNTINSALVTREGGGEVRVTDTVNLFYAMTGSGIGAHLETYGYLAERGSIYLAFLHNIALSTIEYDVKQVAAWSQSVNRGYETQYAIVRPSGVTEPSPDPPREAAVVTFPNVALQPGSETYAVNRWAYEPISYVSDGQPTWVGSEGWPNSLAATFEFPWNTITRLTDIFEEAVALYGSSLDNDFLRKSYVETRARELGRLIGGPYTFSTDVVSVTSPEYRYTYDSFNPYQSAGFNTLAFATSPVPVQYATPGWLKILQEQEGGSLADLDVPSTEWVEGWGPSGWAPDYSRGGFAVESPEGLFSGPEKAAIVQLIMDSGRLYFQRNDGKREFVRVGGSSMAGIVDTEPEFGFHELIVGTRWQQPGKVRSLSNYFGY